MMDTCTQSVTTKRQYRWLEEKQGIVGEAWAEGASLAPDYINHPRYNLPF